MPKIAIIGTAGRGEAGEKLNKSIYLKMYKDALTQLEQLAPNKEDRHLVSGGAAWSDHLAISLFLEGKAASLTLYGPCNWDIYGFDAAHKDGRIANYYHDLFSKKIGKDPFLTRKGIQKAILQGAVYVSNPAGFKARNLQVGNVDIILAYTFGEDEAPSDGGTSHTWRHSKAPVKIHRSINKL